MIQSSVILLANLLNEALHLGLLGGLDAAKAALGVLGCQSLGLVVLGGLDAAKAPSLGLAETTHVLQIGHGLGSRAVYLVGSIATVVVSVTLVAAGDATSIAARELHDGAVSLKMCFIAIISTVVISIAQPTLRNTTVVVALELVGLTGSWRLITHIAAVVVAIVSEPGGNTATIVALPLIPRATRYLSFSFIASVPTIVVSVNETLRDTATIGAGELSIGAGRFSTRAIR